MKKIIFGFLALMITFTACSGEDVTTDPISERSEKSIFGASQMEDMACWGTSYGVYAHSVVHLLTNHGDGNFGECTGFLVSKTNLVTAAHCVGNAAEAANTSVDFDYQHVTCDQAPLLQATSTFGTTLLVANTIADVAVIQLSEDFGSRFGIMNMNFSNLSTTQNLAIAHHPAGQYKQLTRLTDTGACRATSVPGDFYFYHQCDTLPGSSGAPVMLQPGIGVTGPMSVIGMHIQGVSASSPNSNVGVRSSVFRSVVEPYLAPENSCVGKCGTQVINRNGTFGCWCSGSAQNSNICPDKVQVCGRQ